MSTYRAIALALAVTFAAVGLVFFFAPGRVAALFDQASRLAAIPALPAGDIQSGLFRVLAAAYMYIVAWLAWKMFTRPDESVWPAILGRAKLASATFSFALIAVQGPSLVLAANGVVDGVLGLLALGLRRQALRRQPGRRAIAS
jgi:hypothetical protein